MGRLGWQMGELILAEDEVAWVLGCMGASGFMDQPMQALIDSIMEQAAKVAAENPDVMKQAREQVKRERRGGG